MRYALLYLKSKLDNFIAHSLLALGLNLQIWQNRGFFLQLTLPKNPALYRARS